MRKHGKVFYKDREAGIVWQDEDGYGFQYTETYLASDRPLPISMTLPLRKDSYNSNSMLPFFDGLIPEGWLLDLTVKNWKLNINDRMEILLTACKDCIGAVSVERMETIEDNA